MKDTPATFGGPGWRFTFIDHAADVAAGLLWRTVGVADEYSPLEAVLISAPSRRFGASGDPEEYLMLSWPDSPARDGDGGDSGLFRGARGVRPRSSPRGATAAQLSVHARPGGDDTGGDCLQTHCDSSTGSPLGQSGLAELGIPILGTPTGTATLEGADALWLDAKTLLLGTGIEPTLRDSSGCEPEWQSKVSRSSRYRFRPARNTSWVWSSRSGPIG